MRYIILVVAQSVKSYTIKKKKKGYLMVEISLAIALIGIISIPIYSSFSTALKIKKQNLESQKNYIALKSIKNEIDNNVDLESLISLNGEVNLKTVICSSSKINDILDLSKFYASISSYEEFVEINLYEKGVDNILNMRKVKWLEKS